MSKKAKKKANARARKAAEAAAAAEMAEQVGEATVFVSHAWKYKFSDVVAALESQFGGTTTKVSVKA